MDVLFGEADKDYFLYRLDDPSQLQGVASDTINGFQTGVDKIELTDLLSEFGIDPDDAFTGKFVLLTKDGADTLVQFDKDGVGALNPLTIATVNNASVAASDLMLDAFVIL